MTLAEKMKDWDLGNIDFSENTIYEMSKALKEAVLLIQKYKDDPEDGYEHDDCYEWLKKWGFEK